MKMELEATIEKLCSPLEPIATGVEAVLRPLAGVRAVLFDIYGTLLISDSGDVGTAMEGGRNEALGRALAAVGISPARNAGVEDLIEKVKARQAEARQRGVASPEVDIREVWRELLLELGLDSAAVSAEMVARLGMEYECRVNRIWTMPNWKKCLQSLSTRELHMGIVSNAQYYTPLIMRTLMPGFSSELGFDQKLIVYSYQLLQSKPALEIFAGPLRELAARGIGARDTVYVGNDMLNDVWTAKTLGLKTILFAGDQRSLRLRQNHPSCRNLEPDAVVTDLDQIADLLVWRCPARDLRSVGQ